MRGYITLIADSSATNLSGLDFLNIQSWQERRLNHGGADGQPLLCVRILARPFPCVQPKCHLQG